LSVIKMLIKGASRIEEQRRRIKNNEEKNQKLLFVLFYVLFITILCI